MVKGFGFLRSILFTCYLYSACFVFEFNRGCAFQVHHGYIRSAFRWRGDRKNLPLIPHSTASSFARDFEGDSTTFVMQQQLVVGDSSSSNTDVYVMPTTCNSNESEIAMDGMNLSIARSTSSILYNPQSRTNVAAMSAVGIALSASILYSLAVGDQTNLLEGGVPSLEVIEEVADTILDATVPLTTTDAVTWALGESIASVIGVLASLTLAMAKDVPKQVQQNAPTVTELVADGDFLLTQAAAIPLLKALGLPPIAATIAGVFLATIPYEILKLGALQRERRLEENRMMQQLLDEKQARERRLKVEIPMLLLLRQNFMEASLFVDPETLKPISEDKPQLDLVDLFCDVTKWLEYGVLDEQFAGTLSWGASLPPGMESAMFGSLAAVSAQAYADVLYVVFGFGGEERRQRVLSRTPTEWFFLYFSKALYSAILFGVYEATQIPVAAFVETWTSNTPPEGCYDGSVDYSACIQSYVASNPAFTASPSAQFRALVTSAVSIWNRIASIGVIVGT